MGSKPIQVRIANIIPTTYIETEVGGVPGRPSWYVERRQEFEQAVRYQTQALATQWQAPFHGLVEIPYRVELVDDEIKRLQRKKGRHEIVEPSVRSLLRTRGAMFHLIWIVFPEFIYYGYLKKEQRMPHYAHRIAWIPCTEATEIDRWGLKDSRSGINHEFKRYLVSALGNSGVSDIDQNEVNDPGFMRKVLDLLTPQVVQKLADNFGHCQDWKT